MFVPAVTQDMTRLQENDSGLDSPRADSDYDLAGSELSSPELLQVWLVAAKASLIISHTYEFFAWLRCGSLRRQQSFTEQSEAL